MLLSNQCMVFTRPCWWGINSPGLWFVLRKNSVKVNNQPLFFMLSVCPLSLSCTFVLFSEAAFAQMLFRPFVNHSEFKALIPEAASKQYALLFSGEVLRSGQVELQKYFFCSLLVRKCLVLISIHSAILTFWHVKCVCNLNPAVQWNKQ